MVCLIVALWSALGTDAFAVSTRTVQSRLAAKGYLDSKYVTGSRNAETVKSIKIFQIMNGMTATGSLSKATYKRLMSRKAVARKTVIYEAAEDTVYSAFKKKKTAVIVDLSSGSRARIRRVGGTNHLDVEPATYTDTKRIKKLYKKWSWDSRGVVLIAGGRYYAAAINFYPHGDQISKKNRFPGHFCLHVYGSKTHGTDVPNAAHQAAIRHVNAFFQ